MGTNELSALLWKERELLELLHFKLEEEHLLLVSGKSQWIPLATREIENILEKVHAAGLARALEASQLASTWGIDAASPLSRIIEAAPPGPWNEILTAHLTALRNTTAEITRLRDANEQYLRAAYRSTQETLANLGEDTSLYGPSGTSAGHNSGAHIIDTNL
ncbi:flagellar protein FlgN [Paeniglutamicibacter sulfureus]|jgi:hypothetical protein|uniref:Flagellar protein FlgN n=1 Tax=Paeniglutamicibacter sulfureus TaxID=43666 RepID=A0ABU2BMP9_9MICC|nr:flagellar protein FlgN [Paeniglutamicibacter sulfureus]MDR7359930.1 hypothetical protein [Paeniglutamicibacter sulfureus]